MELNDLKESHEFDVFKNFIKKFIMEDEVLFKLIFYNNSNPLLLEMPENPYLIFEENSKNGCVLFRQKNDTIQNEENVTVLIDLYSSRLGNSYFFNSTFITFSIILKGVNIQEVDGGSSRYGLIARRIINNFDRAMVNNIGEVRYEAEKKLSLNESNSGKIISFESKTCSTNINENVNYRKRKYGI